MIMNCLYCQMSTAGAHEWNCPNNPRNYPNATTPMVSNVAPISEQIPPMTDERLKVLANREKDSDANIVKEMASEILSLRSQKARLITAGQGLAKELKSWCYEIGVTDTDSDIIAKWYNLVKELSK